MKIHMMGIGGVGMAGLAVLLQERGHRVSGCDLVASPRTRWLEENGISVVFGHSPAHVASSDLVVVTPAVGDDNPERAAAQGHVRLRGEVLAELVGKTADTIAVCGSHGKTTTATFIAKLLVALGEDVAWAIGGETGDWPVARAASGPLVVEADESDGTLALYRTRTLVVTNCEYDHPDHFKTFADYRACYDAARAQAAEVIEGEQLPPLEGFLDKPAIIALAPHNRRNARIAAEVALRRGYGRTEVLAALSTVVCELPDRRFQQLWPQPERRVSDAKVVVTDYAHHPTEMSCAVGMARSACKGTLRVLFQPHRYSRTRALLNDFPSAFQKADEVVLCPTYAAFESPVEGGDTADLYRVCREAGLPVRLARSCNEAWRHAAANMHAGDLTLLLGAGSIISLASDVSAWGAAGCPNDLPPVRRWIGQGTNTWRSDLTTGEKYVQSDSPAGRAGATLLADPNLAALMPWMSGIPGTVGGWVKMNAGAFGHSISEVLSEVKVDGVWRDVAACGFSYRCSAIEGEIQDVRFRFDSPRDADTSADYQKRRKAFPPGTKGSVFKNPEGDSAGRLLEDAGCKALRVGGAYVWSEHANVIVSGADATASDVLALAQLMFRRVQVRFGVSLEPEVCGLVV